MADSTRFPRLVSLACHDLRTPLATVHGFAKTLSRVELPGPAPRYVEMIEAATDQIAELLDELSLLAQIESGRFEPRLDEVDSLELAREAAGELEEGTVAVSGTGATVLVEVEATRRSLRQLARAARRHGGLENVYLAVAGAQLEIGPISGPAGVVVTGAELRELGAAAAVELIKAQGGSVDLDGERLKVRLPTNGLRAN
jgi:signal transduction histidine kinase